MKNIVGVRYIGSTEGYQENKTGLKTIWLPGEIKNMTRQTAAPLLKHPDAFVEAPIDPEREVLSGATAKVQKDREPFTYVNLDGMDIDSLALYARREFDRQLNVDGRDLSDVRGEVHRLMIGRNLDEIAQERMTDDGADAVPYLLWLHPDVAMGLANGSMRVSVLPSAVESTVEPEIPTQADQDGMPTLSELLEGMTKVQMLDMAKEYEVKSITPRMAKDEIKAALFDALKEAA